MTDIKYRKSYTATHGGDVSAVNVSVVALGLAPTFVENLRIDTGPGRFRQPLIPYRVDRYDPATGAGRPPRSPSPGPLGVSPSMRMLAMGNRVDLSTGSPLMMENRPRFRSVRTGPICPTRSS